MIEKRLILIIILIGALLLMSPVSAKMVTAKVDDKGIIGYGNMICTKETLHTCYGEIVGNTETYNKVEINDTIRYNTDIPCSFDCCWDVEVLT